MKKIALMLATLIDEPFDQKGWIFETKWDGYRILGCKNRAVELISRGGKSYSAKFPTIVDGLKKLKGSFIIDGEVVILDKKGRSNFQLLQNYYKRKIGTPYYCVFDLLELDGENLRKLPLIERKARLKKLVRGSKFIRYTDHIEAKGKSFFKKAVKKGLEGIVAKREDSLYQSGRGRDWLKIKTKMRQEVVIGGFTEPKGGRKWFGSLLVGVYKNGKLVYIGHVGGGFNRQLLNDVYKELQKVRTTRCPFSTEPYANGLVTWVKPVLVCEVAFSEWTDDEKLRQPIFQGMRYDKPAKQVVRE